MQEILIFGILLFLLLVNVPISLAIIGTALLAVTIKGEPSLIIPMRILESLNSPILVSAPFFMLAGEFMGHGGLAKRLLDFANSLLSFLRGGLGMANVGASMFFAEISGAGVADALAIGRIIIPEMERKGYQRSTAAAITTASASIGIIIPPSIPMIILGSTAGISVSQLFIAGIIPGILVGLIMMGIIYIVSFFEKFPTPQPIHLNLIWNSFKEAAVCFLIPLIIIGGIIFGVFSPTEAAAVAVLCSYLIGKFVTKELTRKAVYQSLLNSIKHTSVVMLLIGASGPLLWLFATYGITNLIQSLLSPLINHPIYLLFVISFVLLLLGTLLQATPVIILSAPILMPIITQAGIEPVQFGIVMVLMLALGQQTPPVASVLVATASIANLSMVTLFFKALPYLLAVVLVVIAVILYPNVVLWLPEVFKL